MSNNSLLGKVEALMRKHRGDPMASEDSSVSSERLTPSPDAWLPVLTDVVERGSLPDTHSSEVAIQADPTRDEVNQAALTATAEELPTASVALPEQPADSDNNPSSPEPVDEIVHKAEPDEHEVADHLIDELTPKISGLMQEQVAEELRKSLDQSMASLMANLNANVGEIVRQAVAEKLAEKDKKPS